MAEGADDQRVTRRAHRIALEMAARGHVSDPLSEWPVLVAALRARGYGVLLEPVQLMTTAADARRMAREIVP